MGTPGAYGFRLNGKDKVTYNHYDSYPDGLGRDVLEFLSKTPVKALTAMAKKIKLVKENSKPTAKQIQECRPFTDLQVSTQSVNDWYCLLRNAQGNLDVYNNIPYMIDQKTFLTNSPFCEWAYIINLDEGVLEIYRGFNKDPKGKGRYAKKCYKSNGEYYGVVLLKTIPLKELFKVTKKGISKICGQLEKQVREDDEKETVEA